MVCCCVVGFVSARVVLADFFDLLVDFKVAFALALALVDETSAD
jgi:hypothetical protein